LRKLDDLKTEAVQGNHGAYCMPVIEIMKRWRAAIADRVFFY